MDYNKDELKMLFSEINNYKVLEADEQKRLVKKAQEGNAQARDALVFSNMRYVVKFALKYKNSGLPLGELISEGNMGLIEAIEKFDLKKENNFVSYATWWIRHYIERSIHQSAKSVRLPMNKVRLLQQVKKEQEYLQSVAEYSEEEALQEASRHMNVDSESVQMLMGVAQDSFSLHQEKNLETNTTFLDSLEDTQSVTVEENLEQEEALEVLMSSIRKIPRREADIIEKRYGIQGDEPKSLSFLSKEYGITKERVRQLEKKGIQRLRMLQESYEMVA